jgi:dipeptidyl aminopeptidase/acylaminoacyl peptidase
MPLISKEDALACVGGHEKSHGGRKRYRFYFHTRQQGTWAESVSGWSPTAERKKLLPYCPEYNIGPEYPPALLLHGDADTDVPCEQSTQMAAALTRQGISNRLVVLPGAPHGFDGDHRNPEVKKALEAVVDFFREHLK